MKKYQIIIEGTEYGASGHDLSKKEFDSLKTTSSDLSDIQTVIADYESPILMVSIISNIFVLLYMLFFQIQISLLQF